MRFGPKAAAALATHGYFIHHDWCEVHDRLRWDASALLDEYAAPATVGLHKVSSARKSTALDLLDDDIIVKMQPSLRKLVQKIELMRTEITDATQRHLVSETELQLLRYAPGGYYARHVDDGLGTIDRPLRRSLSFLYYMTPPNWSDDDGGYLRMYPHLNGESIDIAPKAGSLVLFDSAIPHEVLITKRERLVCVGWYLCARNRNN